MLGDYKIHTTAEPMVNMAGTSASPKYSSFWIIDGGANEHMVGNSSLLRNFRSLATSPRSVRLPNGKKAHVSKVGSVSLLIQSLFPMCYLCQILHSTYSQSPSLPKIIVVLSPFILNFVSFKTSRLRD